MTVMGIRARLAGLVVAALLPVLILTAVLFMRDVGRARASIEERVRQQTRTFSLAIEQRLDSSIRTLQALSASPLLESGDLRAYHDLLWSVRRAAHPEWNAVGLVDPAGQEVLSTFVPFGAPLPGYADNVAIREALSRRQPVVSDLALGRLSNRPSMALFVPVLRDGRVLYLLAAALPAETVAGFVDASTLPAGWSLRVLDRQQVTIARVPFLAEAIGQPAHPDFVTQVRAVPDGWWRFTNPKGEALYTAYTRSPRFGWTTGLALPAAAVEGPARAALWTLGGGGLGLLLLGLGLAVVFSWTIARPVASLAEDAAAVGRGESGVPADGGRRGGRRPPGPGGRGGRAREERGPPDRHAAEHRGRRDRDRHRGSDHLHESGGRAADGVAAHRGDRPIDRDRLLHRRCADPRARRESRDARDPGRRGDRPRQRHAAPRPLGP